MEFTYSYDILLLLREKAKLDPISYFKVMKERNLAISTQQILNKKEHCQLGVDFSKADRLEAQLRYAKWQRKIIGDWINDYRSTNFEEFAWEALNRQERKHSLKKK